MRNIALEDFYWEGGVAVGDISDLFGSVPAPPSKFTVDGTLYAFSRSEIREGDLLYWEFLVQAQVPTPRFPTRICIYND